MNATGRLVVHPRFFFFFFCLNAHNTLHDYSWSFEKQQDTFLKATCVLRKVNLNIQVVLFYVCSVCLHHGFCICFFVCGVRFKNTSLTFFHLSIQGIQVFIVIGRCLRRNCVLVYKNKQTWERKIDPSFLRPTTFNTSIES